jgi:hypothetical protein
MLERIVQHVKDFYSFEGMSPWAAGCLFVSVLPVSLAVFFFVVLSAIVNEFQSEYHRIRCSHGVVGKPVFCWYDRSFQGVEGCSLCSQELLARKRDYDAKVSERERKDEIARKANSLQKQEEQRIKGIRLRDLQHLLDITPWQFEDAIALMYKELGYTVKQTPYAGDKGIDIFISKSTLKYAVQCKQYSPGNKVSRPEMQRLLGAMLDAKTTRGIFVTTGEFANTCLEYEKNHSITLVDGQRLIDLLHEAYPPKSNDATVQVMCTECGEIVYFKLLGGEPSRLCTKGHWVKRVNLS